MSMSALEIAWRKERDAMVLPRTQEDAMSTSMENRGYGIGHGTGVRRNHIPKYHPEPDHSRALHKEMRPNEITLKEWITGEMERLHLTYWAIYERINRGYYPELILRRINKRVVFVQKEP